MVQDHLTVFPAGAESSSIDLVAQVRHLAVILDFTPRPIRHRFLLTRPLQ